MSTRCQIQFRSGGTRRTVYRHSDGYPAAVLPDLREFLAWCTRRDPEYATANFIYWSKCEAWIRSSASEQIGFGVCAEDELHGDIEFFYVVDLDTEEITVYEAVPADRRVHLERVAA